MNFSTKTIVGHEAEEMVVMPVLSPLFMAVALNNDKLRGALGSRVYFKLHSDYFARTRAEKIKVSQNENAVNVRLKMTALGELAKAVKYVTTQSFVHPPKGMSHSNQFIRVNYPACTVEDGVASINYDQLVFAQGGMIPPTVEMTFDDAQRTLSFSIAPESEDFEGCRPTDAICAVILDSKYNTCKFVELGLRGEGGDASVKLHPLWDAEQVHIFVFAVNEKKDDTSVSFNLPLA